MPSIKMNTFDKNEFNFFHESVFIRQDFNIDECRDISSNEFLNTNLTWDVIYKTIEYIQKNKMLLRIEQIKVNEYVNHLLNFNDTRISMEINGTNYDYLVKIITFQSFLKNINENLKSGIVGMVKNGIWMPYTALIPDKKLIDINQNLEESPIKTLDGYGSW